MDIIINILFFVSYLVSGDMPELLMELMPTTVEAALTALTQHLQAESDLSKSQIGMLIYFQFIHCDSNYL